MSAHKMALPRMGSIVSRNSVWKLKCNAHALKEENEDLEQCLLELLHTYENSVVYYNLVVANLFSSDLEEAEVYMKKAIEAGYNVCKTMNDDKQVRDFLYAGGLAEVLDNLGC